MTIPAIYNLYSKIILEALSVSQIKLNKCRRDFMIEIFMLYLSIPSRINLLQLGRYGLHGEQRYRRQFEKEFDFFSFNKALSMPWVGPRNAIAFDPSFIHKSGKQTPTTSCLNDNDLSLPDWYAAVIKKRIELRLSITGYVVADAYFSKKNFVEKMRECSLHLVSKLRDDAGLLYLSKQPKTAIWADR